MKREPSLDALRGLAIVGMVLSGSIAFGDVLPAWMYHAQVPPPLHQFNPSIPGITWVDLVFPFFLFSMGAAFPLALREAITQQKPFSFFLGSAFKRFFLLAFFALFSQHLKAWVIATEPGTREQLYSLLAFALLFGLFYSWPQGRFFAYQRWVKGGCFIVALLLLAGLPFHEGAGFDLYKSDIILMVLANMAFFGSLLYYGTAHRPLLRVLILPFVAAIILSAREPADSVVKSFFYFNEVAGFKFDWLYKFYFLKYLFVVLPGTFAGEWMLHSGWDQLGSDRKTKRYAYVAVVQLLLCGLLFLLFYRTHPLALQGAGTWVLLGCCALWLFYGWGLGTENPSLAAIIKTGLFMLLLGLALEPFEGGIKKDPSTFSYYFVCSGLAFLLLPALSMLFSFSLLQPVLHLLAAAGKNPMLAYVAGSLLVLPLLSLTGLKPYWEGLVHTPWQGLLKGLLFTTAVLLMTHFSVKKKWFWKT